ncbi:hypothetical protein B0H15DRAFT_955814 [Mycena belliarum]|uniref:Uncharacterized protein n=1 Tax=Mycena belliarum TaxID=1033014 RepID=A0AAD6XFW9_9AGAR|nr:hypothetical protein B0H15DRAFT_955814 [Mycena belliae]
MVIHLLARSRSFSAQVRTNTVCATRCPPHVGGPREAQHSARAAIDAMQHWSAIRGYIGRAATVSTVAHASYDARSSPWVAGVGLRWSRGKEQAVRMSGAPALGCTLERRSKSPPTYGLLAHAQQYTPWRRRLVCAADVAVCCCVRLVAPASEFAYPRAHERHARARLHARALYGAPSCPRGTASSRTRSSIRPGAAVCAARVSVCCCVRLAAPVNDFAYPRAASHARRAPARRLDYRPSRISCTGGVNGLLAETPDDAAGIGEKLDVLRCPSANQIHAQAAAHF